MTTSLVDVLDQHCLEGIATALSEKGVCVLPRLLPKAMAESLSVYAKSGHAKSPEGVGYLSAGVGRGDGLQQDKRIRSDEILWIDGRNELEGLWLDGMERLQRYLNRHLYLGLFSFESHFAHYPPGAFYEKHVDAFKGQSNRIVSVVSYLNPAWQDEWGGELLVYPCEYDTYQTTDALTATHRIKPELGTTVIFLSEGFPHEVLPATQDRYSIAGWFRVNNFNLK